MKARILHILVMLAMVLLMAAGCGTATRKPGSSKPVAGSSKAVTPFSYRGDYPERVGLIMHDVLAIHGFSWPWVVVRGSESSVWFVTERVKSSRRFDRVFVHVTSGEEVSASITSYEGPAPTDWAILGSLAVDNGPEASAIASEISAKLHDKKP